MNKIFMVGIALLMIFALGGCASNDQVSSGVGSKPPVESSSSASETLSPGGGASSTDSTETNPPEETGTPGNEGLQDEGENTSNEADSSSNTSILIAYFSWSGNTKQLAGFIQEQTGGDLFEIEPETPYTDDINKLSDISLQEQRDHVRPALSSSVEDMSRYDVIFIGYPNWWNNMPMPVFTFLEEYDLSGKTVVPFTTYGNGVWGRSLQSIEEILPEAVILEGFAVQEHELQDAPQEVQEWLLGLDL